MNISPKSAVELLEIIRYLDDELQKKIPDRFVDYLNSIKDPNYIFKINKNINLFENDFMDETVETMMQIMNNR